MQKKPFTSPYRHVTVTKDACLWEHTSLSLLLLVPLHFLISSLLSLFCLSLYLALILCVTYVCLNLFMPYPFLQCPMCSLFLSLCTLTLLSLCFSILSKCSISLPSINHLSLYLSINYYLPTYSPSSCFLCYWNILKFLLLNSEKQSRNL